MPIPEELLAIESEKQKYIFCKPCLKEAQETLSMKIYMNEQERQLLKRIRKFLKHNKN